MSIEQLRQVGTTPLVALLRHMGGIQRLAVASAPIEAHKGTMAVLQALGEQGDLLRDALVSTLLAVF